MNRILLCLALIVCSFAAQAQQAWPTRPVKFIVPSSPGGGTDVYARILAQALAESLKQQFIVDNRPGASGNIVASAISHLKAGKLRALAVTQSTSLLPGTPTFAEAGFPLEVITSFSVVAPAGTPAPIVQRIAAEIGRAMRSKPVAEKLEAQVLVPVFDTPGQFAASLKKERDGWADFIRRNAIQPDQWLTGT